METASIVITCYNLAEFVAQAIDSALAQTYPAVEVVVVDDASTDASGEVIATYGDRVRALRLEANGGAPHARNHGARAARGEWLLFLDADDFIAPDTVAALVEAARGAPGQVAACAWEFLLRRDGGWEPYVAQRPLVPSADPLAGWLRGHWVPPCAVLYPRALYQAAGGFDEALRRNDDGDLAMRCFAAGAGLVEARGGRGFYRRHLATRASLSTDNRSSAALWSQARVFDKLTGQLDRQGRLAGYRALIETQYGNIALHALTVGEHEVARACLERGGAGAMEVVRPRSLKGRLLAAALGLHGKYRVTRTLRRWRAALRRRG